MHQEDLTTLHRAIENGANALAEGFLFSVAALLILGEAWRSSRSQSKRRDSVDDQLEELSNKLHELTARVDTVTGKYEDQWQEEKLR
jgi:optic atrophy 3 protein